jgi:arylsulfatase A-like enzyme
MAPPWALPDDLLTAYFDDGEEVVPWAGTACGPFEGDDEDYLRLHQTYAAVVSHVDGALEVFIEQFRDHPAAATTLLIFTAESGLALGEHGIVGPFRPYLHDELVHLPLLMRLPNADEAGRRVTALTQPVDLYATVLDALGLPLPEGESASLLPLAHGEAKGGRSAACTSLRVGDALEWSLRARDWAYLLPVQQPAADVPRSPKLFAKPEDAWEVNNVRDRHLERAEQLEQQLRSTMQSIALGERHEHREAGG